MEKTRITIVAVTCIALFAAFGAWMFLDAGMDAVTLATLFVHYLPYPALAHVLLSDKAIGMFLKKDRSGP